MVISQKNVVQLIVGKKILVFFILTFFVFVGLVKADYATDYQDYVNKTGIYQSAHNDYLIARANYLASQSIDSKDKAMAATLKMLQARDNVMASYLTVMKSKTLVTLGLSDGDKSSLSSRIDTEVSWYNAHNTKLTSAGSLDDLVSDSDDAKNEFNSLTADVAYTDLIYLGAANNSYIRGELTSEIGLLRAKIDEIKSNRDKDVSAIERSLIDVQNKIDRSQAKDDDAKNLINSIKPTDIQKSSSVADAQTGLQDSSSYLKEANAGLLQIITQIKSAN